jgi:hypothetical protein
MFNIIDRAQAEAVALLKDNWQAVVRVVGVLRDCDQLTSEELDRIIAYGPAAIRSTRSRRP